MIFLLLLVAQENDDVTPDAPPPPGHTSSSYYPSLLSPLYGWLFLGAALENFFNKNSPDMFFCHLKVVAVLTHELFTSFVDVTESVVRRISRGIIF